MYLYKLSGLTCSTQALICTDGSDKLIKNSISVISPETSTSMSKKVLARDFVICHFVSSLTFSIAELTKTDVSTLKRGKPYTRCVKNEYYNRGKRCTSHHRSDWFAPAHAAGDSLEQSEQCALD